MKILDRNSIEFQTFGLKNGEVSFGRIASDKGVGVNLAVIAPDSEVPDPPHKHEAKEIVYVAVGKATLHSNNADHEVNAGNILIFDPWEEHHLTVGSSEVVLFEVKWKE